ncbi:MAG TPA: baseplate J/gp47 family protein [Allosphingosinicella sp.]
MTGALQHCGTGRRRQRVLAAAIDMGGGLLLNGIDFLEIVDKEAPSEALRQRLIDLTFIRPDGVLNAGVPVLVAENFRIEGGSRVKNVRVTQVAKGAGNKTLRLTLDRYGDYSEYELFVQIGETNWEPLGNMDWMLSSVRFHFKVECKSDFDCDDPGPPRGQRDFGPPLNYLAKDYVSFNRLMLDRMAATIPEWTERNASDLGVTLVEALAHAADQTSYFQDAVHTEAFLGRARLRQSVLRHARLLNYTASEGCNARVAVALTAKNDREQADPIFPAGTRLLTRPPRIAGTISTVIPPDAERFEQMINGGSIVFETLDSVFSLKQSRNAMQLYDWGDDACCLLAGSTAAWLVGTRADLGLARGDLIIFEERIPFGGKPADPPDPSHRQVVRLSADPVDMVDPVMNVAVVRIDWHEEDALAFPLTLSDHGGAPGAVAIGNVVLADEGRTIDHGLEPDHAGADEIALKRKTGKGLRPDDAPGTRLRFRLDADRLVHAPPYRPDEAFEAAARLVLSPDAALAVAQVVLDGDGETWPAVPDLLSSDRFSPAVKVEPSGGGGYVLFGDGNAGREPAEPDKFSARIRHGGGRRGNIGPDAIGHIVTGDGSDLDGVRNPVRAAGGLDPEPVAAIRIAAPHAFQRQRRAVTPADYAAAAQEHDDVQRAQATPRWTGSWQTIFLAVDRLGGREVDDAFEESLRAHLASRRLAGHDLEIVPPRFVPCDIVLYVCVCSDHYRGDVERDLLKVFSSGYTDDGRAAFFHPDNFTFGDNVMLSQIIARGMAVEGVTWIGTKDAAGNVLGRFGRLDEPDVDYQDEAEIPVAADEVARLDNDPSFPDFGRLRLIMAGGR